MKSLLLTWLALHLGAILHAQPADLILRNGKDVIWKKRCVSKSENEFVLEGNYVHKLIGEILHIEGRYKATR